MAKPLKVGLVGTGGISRRHLPAYQQFPDQVQLTAACDIVEDAVAEFGKRNQVDAIYTDFEKMLREADIDAVDICTAHNAHAPLAIAAAEAGKHAITEKPMAISLDECRQMIEAADKAGVTLMVAQHLRSTLEARAVKRMLDDGTLGEIQAVKTHAIQGGGRPRPRAQGISHWGRDKAVAGGGILMMVSVHHIDLLRYYAGDVKRVTGICQSIQPHMLNGAEDMASATLEFESGAIGNLFANGTTYLAPEGSSYQIFGSNGTIISTRPTDQQREIGAIPHFGDILYRLREENPDMSTVQNPKFDPIATDPDDLPTTNGFINEILHFADCCRTGEEPVSSGRDNIGTVKTIMGIYEASRTGGWVDLDTL